MRRPLKRRADSSADAAARRPYLSACPFNHDQHIWPCEFAFRQAALSCRFLGALVQLRGQSETPSPSPNASPFDETIVPTFETQKLARTYVLDIPAPRGLITDRNGAPLAQNRLSYNLAINFPTPLDFSDSQLLAYVREKIQAAEKLLGRPLKISDDLIKRHYHNRGILPFEIAQNLSDKESDDLKAAAPGRNGVAPVLRAHLSERKDRRANRRL